jgi:hypothetical protein
LQIKTLGQSTLTIRDYEQYGKYHFGTVSQRFGSWNKAVLAAGMPVNIRTDIMNEELFNNLAKVWTTLGRQPKRREMKAPLSEFSEGPYIKRFGGWTKSLTKFIEFINKEQYEDITDSTDCLNVASNRNQSTIKHKTKRNISDRLRFSILIRDGFACRSCGASPTKELGVELHVDHIVPWSKGGETVPQNLETKCKKCNLGKGNAFSK